MLCQILTNLILILDMNQNYIVQCALMNYTVFHKDRNVNGGGVFVATTDRIISYEIPDLDTDCDMIWAGLHF